MLLQTNSYIVPKERRSEHARLMRRFRQVLGRLGCEDFEVYEQTGANWTGAAEGSQRFVQIMRFRDRKHHAALQAAERNDQAAQQLIAEFCALVNFPYQQQQGFFAVGYYTSVLPALSARPGHEGLTEELPADAELATAPEGLPDEGAVAPPGESTAAAPTDQSAAETQAYAAQELAESHEPGHLSDSEGLAIGGDDPAIGGELAELAEQPSLMSAEPSVDPEQPVTETAPEAPAQLQEAQEPPAKGRRRKKAKG